MKIHVVPVYLDRTLDPDGLGDPWRFGIVCGRLRMYAVAFTLGVNQQHVLLRKEVIQPHLPIRLPCYDFVPLT